MLQYKYLFLYWKLRLKLSVLVVSGINKYNYQRDIKIHESTLVFHAQWDFFFFFYFFSKQKIQPCTNTFSDNKVTIITIHLIIFTTQLSLLNFKFSPFKITLLCCTYTTLLHIKSACDTSYFIKRLYLYVKGFAIISLKNLDPYDHIQWGNFFFFFFFVFPMRKSDVRSI